MSAREILPELLERWRTQTLAETAAIRAGNWCAVQECQRAKEDLQPRLQQALRAEGTGGSATLQQAIEELIAMEIQNREWLNVQRAGLQAQCTALNSDLRNLRKVRTSYGQPGSSCWQSYG
jgi:hypothetical protein